MNLSAYCALKAEDRFQVVITIIVQERDKNYPTTATEVFDIAYQDGNYTLTERNGQILP